MNGIVFINPPLSIEERYGVKSQSGGQTPPLGLANLAAITRQHGFRTSILDAAALRLTYEEIVKRVVDGGYQYAGFTAVTISIDHAAHLAALLKQANPSIRAIIGGPHFTALPEKTFALYNAFDIGVIGEADITIIELLQNLDTDGDLETVAGLMVRTPSGAVRTAPRERVRDLDALPKPAWDLLPDLAKHYCPPVHTLKRIPAALLIASRGCPGHCAFCDRSVFGNVLRAYSAQYTFELIEELYERYGIREIQLRDDNFVAYRKRLKELCEILKRKKLNLVWTCTGRVDMVNPEILATMKEAGCWQIWYGIESGSQDVLKAIKKQTTIEQIERAVGMTHDAGISPCGFFIVGHPTETRESMDSTIRLALRLPLDEAHFSFMTPFPGSELYRRAHEFGSFDSDWKKLHGWLPVFVPWGLTPADLERASKRAFRSFYFRPRIVWAYLLKIRGWRQLRIYFMGFLALLEWLCYSRSSSKTPTS
jgi:radical SAM superfamily enzyme YgiQ (UPF0313 family)